MKYTVRRLYWRTSKIIYSIRGDYYETSEIQLGRDALFNYLWLCISLNVTRELDCFLYAREQLVSWRVLDDLSIQSEIMMNWMFMRKHWRTSLTHYYSADTADAAGDFHCLCCLVLGRSNQYIKPIRLSLYDCCDCDCEVRLIIVLMMTK